jgi:hypothetical protein
MSIFVSNHLLVFTGCVCLLGGEAAADRAGQLFIVATVSKERENQAMWLARCWGFSRTAGIEDDDIMQPLALWDCSAATTCAPSPTAAAIGAGNLCDVLPRLDFYTYLSPSPAVSTSWPL